MIPTHCGEHRKNERRWAPTTKIDCFQHPLDGNAIAKSHSFSNCFSIVFKSSKIQMHFLHTSSILSVSLFEIAKLALAKRYAHCCFVNSDACRLGGLLKNRIRAPTVAGRTFLCSAPSVGMQLLQFDENPCARIAIFVMPES